MPRNSHNYQEIYDEMGINIDRLGCVMVDLEPIETPMIMDFKMGIYEYLLYYTTNPDRKWIKGFVMGDTPHITLMYGLLDNVHNWEKYVSKVLEGWEMDSVEIDHIGFFDNPYVDEEYYCIVAHIKVTPELEEGHDRLEFLPHINTFEGYKPHMTIAYIKKDDAKRDQLIADLSRELVGKKLAIKKEINLGYQPKENK